MRLRAALDVGRIEDVSLRHQHRGDAHRNVDVEDPAPRVAVGEPAAEHRAEDRRHHDAEPPEAHRLAALVGRERLEQHRLRQRLQRAAGEALDDAEHHQRRQAPGEAAEEGRDGEAAHRHQQQPLAAEEVGEPAGHRQDDGVRHQVRGERPGGFVDGRRQAAGDVRQRDVDDGGVEDLHEGREHDRDRHQPRVHDRYRRG